MLRYMQKARLVSFTTPIHLTSNKTLLHQTNTDDTRRSIVSGHFTVQSVQAEASNLFRQRGAIIIVGWFAGRTCKNQHKWNQPAKLVCKIYTIYK